MAQNFIDCSREQAFLLPPDVREWLPEGHLAWFVIDAVTEMDLSAFYAAYRQDGHGRAAYEPSMMVALLLYAYARGQRSSRAIERACEEDVLTACWRRTRSPITPPWHGSSSAMSTRSLACSAKCWGCAPRPGW
jgi:hypothetical protein